jgi:hypothetical protein
LFAADPENPRLRDRMAANFSFVGYAMWGIARLGGGEATYREAAAPFHRALEIAEGSVTADPIDRNAQRRFSSTLSDVSQNQLFLGEAAAAIPGFQRALAIAEKISAPIPITSKPSETWPTWRSH